MSKPAKQSKTDVNAGHHTQAAECCDKAAEQHRHAAKSYATGNQQKAGEHAKAAHGFCTEAHHHGKQALAS
jgi:hypothetical protein